MDYLLIGLAIIIAIAVAYFKTPTGKGVWGEIQVKLALGKNKPDKKYVINNLMIVNEGKSSQIDHVLINQTGIFVIETKNYAGRIYGSEDQKEWTQVLAYGKVKNKFYNPILQNRTHIYALSKVLGQNKGFVSIIVFPKATLMTKTMTDVGYMGNVNRRIKKQKAIVFSIEEMNEIYRKLLDYKTNPPVSNKEHVAEIKEMVKNIENNICPRCGKSLVLRKGKNGDFYGCSGYPNCRFIKTK